VMHVQPGSSPKSESAARNQKRSFSPESVSIGVHPWSSFCIVTQLSPIAKVWLDVLLCCPHGHVTSASKIEVINTEVVNAVGIGRFFASIT
jgi:hypothetical protein